MRNLEQRSVPRHTDHAASSWLSSSHTRCYLYSLCAMGLVIFQGHTDGCCRECEAAAPLHRDNYLWCDPDDRIFRFCDLFQPTRRAEPRIERGCRRRTSDTLCVPLDILECRVRSGSSPKVGGHRTEKRGAGLTSTKTNQQENGR
jgi:hypothetical protein